MKEESIINLLPIAGNKVLTFSCFHDEMFVFELQIETGRELFMEVTFFPKDNACINLEMNIDEIIDEADFTKYFNARVLVEEDNNAKWETICQYK